MNNEIIKETAATYARPVEDETHRLDVQHAFMEGAKWALTQSLQWHSMDEEPRNNCSLLLCTNSYELYTGNYKIDGLFRLDIKAPLAKFDKSHFAAWAYFADLFNKTNFDEVTNKNNNP